MDETSIIQYITETFGGVDRVEASGDSFFFYDPGGELPPDHRMPFATLVTNDERVPVRASMTRRSSRRAS